MIVHITHGMTRLGLHIKEYGSGRLLVDWESLQLLISPGQYDSCCGPNGSPWILTGCWPGKHTGVDVANARPDFPTIIYDAFELDADGRVVFRLDDYLFRLPSGRYTGAIRTFYNPNRKQNACTPPCMGSSKYPAVVLKPAPRRPHHIIPPEYLIGATDCAVDLALSVKPPKPKPKSCVLAVFDIDLGSVCSDHLVSQVNVEFALSDCALGDL